MKLFQKKQTSFLTFLVIAQLFVMNIAPALALFGGPSIPSPSGIMSDIEKRYHLDPAALQNQGEMMNVSANKGYAPEVLISFSPSDPKSGEKITAKAFPMYFSNPETELYYTWTLKRKGCGLDSSPSTQKIKDCDRDGNEKITVEDWKIEATRILVQDGYTSDLGPNLQGDTDKDGYESHYGGNDKVGMPSHCYINDVSSGTNYELGKASNVDFGCTGGTSPVCMVSVADVTPEELDTNVPGTLFSFTDTGQCTFSGIPSCSNGTVVCNVGEPRCVTSPSTTTSCGSAISTCSATSESDVVLYCKHLFPKFSGYTSGDGSFGLDEEQKWGTNPNDPSTADNSNKDEANVVGLGQSSFTWNYEPGDKVGVVVEGSSLFTTKYDDSSSMIMWAFSKKDCPLSFAESTGSYVKSIKGYNVTLPVADVDLNDCIERNLVDPTEGGQATKLEVSVTSSPTDPLNDPGTDKSGDLLTVQSMIDNAAQSTSNTSFKWTVSIASTTSAFSGGTATDITRDLRNLGLLGNTQGNALDALNLKLDIPKEKMILYGIGETGYLRFRVDAEEHFAGGGVRKGNSDVIVKFLSTSEKITAYKVQAGDVGERTKVSLSSTKLCNGTVVGGVVIDVADRTICRVIKNEIIGLKVDVEDTNPDLTNFYWTVNNTPLVCTERVSEDCKTEAQGNINYFPVTGNIGDTYTVVVTANNIITGKVVTLTRAFNVVEPRVVIESTDESAVWRKYLGKYKDIANLKKANGTETCPGGYCDDLSESVYQTYDGTTAGFQARMIPNMISDRVSYQWLIDGVSTDSPQTIVLNSDGNPVLPSTSLSASRAVSSLHNIGFIARFIESDEIRKALLDIWGISSFESPEVNLSSSIQLEVQEALLTDGPLVGPRKYYAAIASYIPASILFTFRISISVMLVLFVLGMLHSLLEERRVEAFVKRFSQKR